MDRCLFVYMDIYTLTMQQGIYAHRHECICTNPQKNVNDKRIRNTSIYIYIYERATTNSQKEKEVQPLPHPFRRLYLFFLMVYASSGPSKTFFFVFVVVPSRYAFYDHSMFIKNILFRILCGLTYTYM